MVMSFPTDQSTFYILKQIATLNSDFISAEQVYILPSDFKIQFYKFWLLGDGSDLIMAPIYNVSVTAMSRSLTPWDTNEPVICNALYKMSLIWFCQPLMCHVVSLCMQLNSCPTFSLTPVLPFGCCEVIANRVNTHHVLVILIRF